MTPITRVALIGAGRIATLHANAIRAAGAELAAVVSSSAERGVEAAARLGASASFSSVETMLQDESIQAVHVTSPNSLHAGHVAQVIAAGRHFVCEKPFVSSSDEAHALSAAARTAGVVGTVAFTYRYHPLAREARARVAAGEVGSLITVRGGYVQDWLLSAPASEWRLDAARSGTSRAFGDVGSHLIDLLEFVAGERISRLVAVERSALAPRDGVSADDAIALAVQLEQGAIGSLLVSQVTAGRGQSLTLEVSGTSAGISIDQEDPTFLWRGTAGTGVGERIDLTAGGLSDSASALGFRPSGTWDDYFHAFAAFVRDSYAAMDGKRVDALPTIDDGVRAVLVGEAVRESARSIGWVSLN
jgi:predicted dehydrogenase